MAPPTRLTKPTPAARPAPEGGRAPSPAPRRGRAARAGGRGDSRWARLQRLEALRRECVTPAEGTVGCGRPADWDLGARGKGEAVARALAAASCAARDRWGIASEQPPSPFIPAAPPPFPGSGRESEVSVPSVPGGGFGLRPRLPSPTSGPAPRRLRPRAPEGSDAGRSAGASAAQAHAGRPGLGPSSSCRRGAPRGVWRAPRCVGATILCEGMPPSFASLRSRSVPRPCSLTPSPPLLPHLEPFRSRGFLGLVETQTWSDVEFMRFGSVSPTRVASKDALTTSQTFNYF